MSQTRLCASCGERLVEDALACPRCGEPVVAGERKLVTVLFADLAGYTELSTRLDPEEVHTFLGPVLTRLRLMVEDFGGSVPKVMGDGLLAVFGVPAAHEDDAERAVRAALALHEHIDRMNRAGQDPPIPGVHSGVNTGEVLVVGSRDAAGYDVVGDPVNIASRLSGVANSGEVIVGERTQALSAHAIRYGRKRVRSVRGKAGVVTFAAIRVSGGEPAGRVHRHTQARFVGRHEERARLGQEIASVRRERRSRVMLVEGEPGIGKSRLAEAVRSSHADVTWLPGRCPPYGQHLPLFAIADGVRALLDLDEDLGERALQTRAAPLVRGPLGPFVWQVRLLTGMHGHVSDRTMGPSLSTAAQARSVIETLARRRTVVVALDDLQWGDLDLIELLLAAHAEPWPAKVLFLGMVRREAPPELLALPMIHLDGLPPAQMRTIAHDVLGSRLPGEVSAGLVGRADGNPLFLEEGTRMLVESGALRPRAGRWEVTDRDALERVPETLRALIAARIDGLAPEEKRVMQSAAVCGDTIWVGLLERLSDAVDVPETVRMLRTKDLLIAGDEAGQLRFKHRLIRDVAERSLPRAARAELHRRIAAWLRMQSSEDVPAIAHHDERAWWLARSRTGPGAGPKVAAQAARSLDRWGAMAFAHVPRVAEDVFARAARAARDAGDDDALAEALVGRADSLIELGRHTDAAREARRGLALADTLGRDDLRARSLMALGRIDSDRGHVRRARSQLRKALDLFERAGDPIGRAWTLHRLSEAERFEGLPAQVTLLHEALALFEEADDAVGRGSVLQDLAYLLTVVGGVDYHHAYERARSLADAEGDARSQASLLRTRAYHAYYTERHATAIRAARSARPLAHDAGDRWVEVDSLLVEALATAASRAPEEAEPLAREVIKIADANDARHLRAMGSLALVRIAAGRGNAALARRRLREARASLESLDATAELAEVDLAEADMQMRLGRPGRVSEPATRAQERASGNGWILVAEQARGLQRAARRSLTQG